jgi:hypothetical protein
MRGENFVGKIACFVDFILKEYTKDVYLCEG